MANFTNDRPLQDHSIGQLATSLLDHPQQSVASVGSWGCRAFESLSGFVVLDPAADDIVTGESQSNDVEFFAEAHDPA